MSETYKHRLDVYYLSSIVYTVTLILYSVIVGSLEEGSTFTFVWQDPIVYLLGACSIASLVALVVAAWSRRRIIVDEGRLTFQTRMRERTFTPTDFEWIGFRSERGFRGEKAFPVLRLKLRDRRRPLRLRPAGFERSGHLARTIRDWAAANGVEVRRGRRRRSTGVRREPPRDT